MNTFAKRVLAATGWQSEVDAALRAITLKFSTKELSETRAVFQLSGEIEMDEQDLQNLAKVIKKHSLRFRVNVLKGTWAFFE